VSNNKLNFIFFGTPDVASETLQILKQGGYTPSLIVTSPDAKAGRKMLLTPPPVKIWAGENNIPFIQPEKLEEKEIRNILKISSQAGEPRKAIFQQENMRGDQNIPDFFLVVAYGKIIPENILNIPRLGSLNIHYSLLPKYRGASPVESAILNGETETGVTIQKMVFALDAGDIIAQEKIAIDSSEKAPDLRKRMIKIGGELLVKILPEFVAGKIKAVRQDERQATLCKKIKKEDGLIDLQDDAATNYNKFRAYAYWPRTFFFAHNKRVIITDAEMVDNKFKIKKVLPEGKKEIKYEEFIKNTS
jgi:methionyl-tRNA formyltransferase